ncbi:MFS transporter [Marinobacterium ramblicola]|uniref:MFS transporter n=1 Tax=Marinobacterium ramblicola TaxID=2849041 RepID=UPI001C2D2E82
MLAILSMLATLQHNATLADLLKQRLSVVAQSTAGAFRPIVNIGLPLSMLRNARQVLDHARAEDANIDQIHVIENDGAIIHSTSQARAAYVSATMQQAMRFAEAGSWSIETEADLISAVSIQRRDGTAAGWVVVIYTKEAFNRATDLLQQRIINTTLLAWAAFSAFAWCLLRVQLGGAIKGFSQIKQLLSLFSQLSPGSPPPSVPDARGCGFFTDEIPSLHSKLIQAAQRYHSALSGLDADNKTATTGQTLDIARVPLMVKQAPDSSLARAISRRLVPGLVLLLLAAVLLQGWYIYSQVRASFEPEQTARLELIGSVANSNIQRAISAGIPLEALVGVSRYFDELLDQFPEVSYLAIISPQKSLPVFQAGAHTAPSSPFWRTQQDRSSFPISDATGKIGQIVIEANPHYFAMQLRFLILDLAVVVLVAALLAYQVVIVTLSFSMTGPFNRLNHLLNLQAAGDFSSGLSGRRNSELDRAAAFLSERADTLYRMHAATCDKPKPPSPKLLQFAYLNDIRLPVFLFGLADALSISFLPVYTRSVENPLQWIDPGVVLSLPLAGYLLATILGAPLVRPLNSRWGSRRLLLVSALLIVAANLGLSLATTTVTLILFRTISGLGYAISTHACQDYVLDVVTPEVRGRSLGLFTSALFGGIFTGAAAGGIIADRSGAPTVFLLGSGLALLAGALAWLLLPRHPRTQAEPIPRLRDLILPLRSARFSLLVFTLAIPSNVMIQAFIAFLVALQLDALGASAADVSRVVMLYFLLVAIVVPVAPRLLDGVMAKSSQAITGTLIAATALATTFIWPSYWAMVAAVTGVGLGQSLIRDPEVSIAMGLAETELSVPGRDTVLSSLRVLERTGSILGLILIAFVASLAGYPVAIAAISVWLFTGGLILLIVRSRYRLSY